VNGRRTNIARTKFIEERTRIRNMFSSSKRRREHSMQLEKVNFTSPTGM